MERSVGTSKCERKAAWIIALVLLSVSCLDSCLLTQDSQETAKSRKPIQSVLHNKYAFNIVLACAFEE